MSDRHAQRRSRAWAALLDSQPEADAFVVTALPNVRYLTGFTGSNGVLLLGADFATLGTDGRYVIQAGAECPDLPLIVDRVTLTTVVADWSRTRGGVLALEADHVSLAAMREMRDAVADAKPVEFRETRGVVEGCRIIKDDGEVELLTRACRVSDEALALVVASVRVGDTERQIARRLEAQMYACGADAISFETIVGGGPHSAIPHHSPTDRPLERGDFLLIDFGAEVGGYHADETRTFVMGSPQPWQVETHALVLAAQAAGISSARAGADLVDVDFAARSVIVDAGHGDLFAHGLGHGVGLQIHEAPFFSARSVGMLHRGSPVTVEPGVYFPDRGGVRIEDTVLVTDGLPQPLTTTERGLTALG
ncbi:MAG: aminopeptidase P family protein [Actinomycetales bacterium]|nr:aminopeptidase P family protein [Actinomycetales bacterium]